MEMPGLPVGVLEPESALTKIHFAGDAGVDHPLQRAIHRCPADAMVVVPNEIDQVVGAEVSFLAEKDVDNLLPLAGALATGRFQPTEIWESCQRYLPTFCPIETFDVRPERAPQALKDCPQPHVDVAFGFLIVNPPPVTVSTKSTSAPLR